jgi:hypothetical protein
MTTKQRVNIQYSIEVDELPKTVNRLYGTALSQLEEVLSRTSSLDVRKQLLEYENYNFCVEAIDEIRTVLADVDYRLGDCATILTGMARLNAPPPAQPTTVTEDADTSGDGETDEQQ